MMVRLCAYIKQYNNYHLQQSNQQNKELLTKMKLLTIIIIPEHKSLWMQRNKMGGLEGSLESIRTLALQVDENLSLLDKNILIRTLNRNSEKLKTAAAVIYLK